MTIYKTLYDEKYSTLIEIKTKLEISTTYLDLGQRAKYRILSADEAKREKV